MKFSIFKRRGYQSTLNKCIHALTRPMPDLDEFSSLASLLLFKTLKLSEVAIMVLDRENHYYVIRAGYGEAANLIGQIIPATSPIFAKISEHNQGLSRSDVMRNINARPPLEKELFEKLRSEMDLLKTELIMPAISESGYFSRPTLLATINLGKKLSGRGFSGEDLEFLRTVADQMVINIEYAFILEEFKRQQNQLLNSEKLAAIGAITASIAHELKNPLTYLMINAAALPTNWDKPSFKESFLQFFPNEVNRMKQIIDGLSDYSKSQALKIEPVSLAVIINNAMAVLGYEIKKNNVKIINSVGADTQALGDKNRLTQICLNLIANAVQAIGAKGGKVSIDAKREANSICLSFTDNGPGIPEDKLKKIFEPFFTTKDSGTGLGLAITKQLVDQHKGEIRVESILGKGTKFTVSLPAV